jgi:dipeptidase E
MIDEDKVVPFPGGDRRQIVSFGGGGFSMEAGNPLLDDYVLSLTGAERPRVCFLPTASGDADHYIVRFYQAFSAERCIPSHVTLFRRDRGAPDLREAWEAGVVLCGLSAGSLCWFSEGVTSFHGKPARIRGLGLLPWSNCVHYGNEPGRREAYHEHLRRGMCPGYAAEDGSALHFRGPRLVGAVSSRPEARAWCAGDGGEQVVETALPTRYLGTPPEAGQGPAAGLSAVA